MMDKDDLRFKALGALMADPIKIKLSSTVGMKGQVCMVDFKRDSGQWVMLAAQVTINQQQSLLSTCGIYLRPYAIKGWVSHSRAGQEHPKGFAIIGLAKVWHIDREERDGVETAFFVYVEGNESYPSWQHHELEKFFGLPYADFKKAFDPSHLPAEAGEWTTTGKPYRAVIQNINPKPMNETEIKFNDALTADGLINELIAVTAKYYYTEDVTLCNEGRTVALNRYWLCKDGDPRQAVFYRNTAQCNRVKEIPERLKAYTEKATGWNLEVVLIEVAYRR